jgi:simple sugar transport system ATP-binding protein
MAQPIIELRDITKRYVGVTAVANLSLALRAGEVFCLLGENGAGKSTVIKILTGVETPSSGEVLVDGAPVRFASPRDAREYGIATVYQEVGTLPLMSVARNFVLGAEPSKGKGLLRRFDKQKAAALALQTLRDLGISRVTNGDQLVGTMSGGERQALAIGRAVHFGARLLVLDEPTAALDVRAEAVFFDRFLELTKGLTTILISHRFSTVRRADRIVVLEHGRLVEDGTHEQLLAANGRYADLFHLQAARFQS